MGRDKHIIDNILKKFFTMQHIWIYEDRVKYLQRIFNRIRKKAVQEYIENNNLKGKDEN